MAKSARPVRITGMASLRRVLRQAPDDMREGMVGAVDASLNEVRAEMLARVPRDSGDLASTIKVRKRKDGTGGRVGVGLTARDRRLAGWRAHFIEFGTVKMPAQPFIFAAAREKRAGIRQRLAEAVGATLVRIAGKG